MSVKIAASVLASNFLNLEKDITRINESSVEWLHLDVMDGNFVKNLSFGPDIIKNISTITNKVLDVHLMIQNPIDWVGKYADLNVDYVNFHFEACNSNEEILICIEAIKKKKKKVGITINPDTSIKKILKYLEKIDLILVMSVYPGFGGQSFISNSIDKIKKLNSFRNEYSLDYLIQIDGGINNKTYLDALEAGCDVLVSGSYLFDGDIEKNTERLRV